MDAVDQVKGIGMVPKQAMDVMSGEVNRILVLAKHHVIPVPYIVPRKVSTGSTSLDSLLAGGPFVQV